MGVILLTSGFVAGQERRHLDAREHGVGHLRIAVEGKAVVMELQVPGADIVGSEHPARAAIGVLAEPLALFRA